MTRIVKMPKARRRISPSWLSLKATGSRVPQRMLVKTFRLTKYTSARNGLGEPPRQGEEPGQDRQVLGRERVAAGPEDVEPLAVAEEDRGLVLAHDELGAHLDVARAVLRDSAGRWRCRSDRTTR